MDSCGFLGVPVDPCGALTVETNIPSVLGLGPLLWSLVELSFVFHIAALRRPILPHIGDPCSRIGNRCLAAGPTSATGPNIQRFQIFQMLQKMPNIHIFASILHIPNVLDTQDIMKNNKKLSNESNKYPYYPFVDTSEISTNQSLFRQA